MSGLLIKFQKKALYVETLIIKMIRTPDVRVRIIFYLSMS